MRYPREYNNVVSLAENMITGITENPDKFPSCDAAILQSRKDQFAQISAALADAQAQASIIAARKLELFNQLCTDLKCQIKLGSVDNVETPENLTLIGWGTKRPPSQLEIPGGPTGLKIIAQGDNGLLVLVWSKSKTGGPMRNYIIERRQLGASWSEWQFIGTSYNNEVKLKDQPTGIKLEYQIRAGNTSGESLPSNVVSVIL